MAFVKFRNNSQFGNSSYGSIEELEGLITALIHDGFRVVDIPELTFPQCCFTKGHHIQCPNFK
jgi:hypothetical protein